MVWSVPPDIKLTSIRRLREKKGVTLRYLHAAQIFNCSGFFWDVLFKFLELKLSLYVEAGLNLLLESEHGGSTPITSWVSKEYYILIFLSKWTFSQTVKNKQKVKQKYEIWLKKGTNSYKCENCWQGLIKGGISCFLFRWLKSFQQQERN